jgi:hypothetical protein
VAKVGGDALNIEVGKIAELLLEDLMKTFVGTATAAEISKISPLPSKNPYNSSLAPLLETNLIRFPDGYPQKQCKSWSLMPLSSRLVKLPNSFPKSPC